MHRVIERTLPQHTTNGNSTLGTPDSRRLPDFLTSNPLPGGFPWGDRTDLDNDPYHHTPDTGVTRYYEFTIARAWISPDGYNKSSILVNGEFPGPAIEANWGDWIEVVVHNNITSPAEGTGIHWHGILQKDTPWYDGVPGISQCPIAPGSSFTYRFRADVYGTSWWHSHFSAQYTAGVFGPLIVYGPKHEPYDIDVGPVLLGDYYHREYFDVVKEAATPTEDFDIYVPWSDNNLINGKNNYNCSMKKLNDTAACVWDAGLAQFKFTPGKTHRLRLVNVGAAALLHFSIDKHRMKVIAHDFEPVVPYEADFITLGAAQRTDILVTADQDPLETYWIRSTITRNCSVTHNPHALAILSYEGNNDIQEPGTNISAAAAAADDKSFLCKNDDLNQTVPYFPQPMTEPDTEVTIEVDLLTNGTGHHIWIMNNRTQRTNYHWPLLLEAAQGNTSLPEEWNVYDFGSNKTVRIVLNTVYQSGHPMHLHGHGFVSLHLLHCQSHIEAHL